MSGGMCAGLGIAILALLAFHRMPDTQLVPTSVPTPAAAALGFAACGLALIGIGLWFPLVTWVLAMVTLAMVISLVAERAFGVGPIVETLIAANLGVGDWSGIAPNTMAALLLATVALFLRHSQRWFEKRLETIAVLGSIIFSIGVVASVGYMTGVPTYVWQAQSPMSFLCAIGSCVLGLGVIMSASRFSELDEAGRPRWFIRVLFVGAVAINLFTAVAYIFGVGQTWKRAEMIGLMPMIIVSGLLSGLAAWQARRQGDPAAGPLPPAASCFDARGF